MGRTSIQDDPRSGATCFHWGERGCGSGVRPGGNATRTRPYVFEATGVPAVARTTVELVAQAGRVVIVGLSHTEAPIRVGDLAFKEIDVLGVSCCQGQEFADAVSLVTRRQDVLRSLVTREFALEETPAAIEYAIGHPAEVMKAVVRLEAS